MLRRRISGPKDGNYTALFHTGKVTKVRPDGQQELIATIPPDGDARHGIPPAWSLIIEAACTSPTSRSRRGTRRTTWATHAACRDATVTASGVYKIELATGKVAALAAKADGWPFCFPDDVDIDEQGNVYITDLTYAGIWTRRPKRRWR